MLSPLAASLVQPVISSLVKGIIGSWVRRAGRGYINKNFSDLFHSLNNIKTTNYFNHKPRFNDAFSRNNLPRIKDGAYVINLDDKSIKGTHLVSLFTDKKFNCAFRFFCNWIYSSRSIKQNQR